MVTWPHAGHIGAKGGKVNHLDDDSGHYRPTEAHTFDAFNRLADQGVLDPTSASGHVELVDKSVGKEDASKRGRSARVHFSGYQQAGGDETAIRNRMAVFDELTAKTAEKRKALDGPEVPAGTGGMVFDPDALEPPRITSAYSDGGAMLPRAEVTASNYSADSLPSTGALPVASSVSPHGGGVSPTSTSPYSATPGLDGLGGMPAPLGGGMLPPTPTAMAAPPPDPDLATPPDPFASSGYFPL